MSKILQNISLLSQGPNAVADPCVSVYHGQQHFGYRDQNGMIWDSWYDLNGNWALQQINGLGGQTAGPAAFAGPFIGVFHDQQHFAYLDTEGFIWDSWYDGKGNWKLQQITALESGDVTAFIDRSPGAPLPEVAVWTDPSNTQQHFTYLTGVETGAFPFHWEPWFLSDIFYQEGDTSWYPGLIELPDSWNRQTLQDTGVQATRGPFVGVFGNQQHITYVDDGIAAINDHWYDGDGNWNFQRITAGNSGGTGAAKTAGPVMLYGTRPAIWVDRSRTQQHFTYAGVDRAIYDAFWDSNSNDWTLQKLTLGGKTDGPAAWSSPSVCNYPPSGSDKTVYVAYRDQSGTIWTVAYGSGSWDAVRLKDVPLGPTDSTIDLPPAAGDVRVWTEPSHGIHFTFRARGLLGPIIRPPVPPVALEARVVGDARPLATLAPAHAGPANFTRESGAIWDCFYEPAQ
jgi:hypothetical protein